MKGILYALAAFAVAFSVICWLEWYLRTGGRRGTKPGPAPPFLMRLSMTARLTWWQRAKRAAVTWRRGERVRKRALFFPRHGVFTLSDVDAALQWIGATAWDVWECPGHLLIRVPLRFVEPMRVVLEPRTPILIRIDVEPLWQKKPWQCRIGLHHWLAGWPGRLYADSVTGRHVIVADLQCSRCPAKSKRVTRMKARSTDKPG